MFSLMLVLIKIISGEDFYDLLGLQRQATTRDIRKAFKRLALNLHPDKNRDDPDAHDKFLKINRAYEVLKDEDLRKKYDLHGEEGLKENGPSGRGYQSWNYYNQDFGIYDDDPEVITLSKSDFEISVDSTEDIWFINFYSPRCSHCHDLAPSWRELARELFGVIRIGAVNCEDDWQLCRQKGVHSYPTLILYPKNEKYVGSRSSRDLVKYALSHVRSQVFDLWKGNFQSTVKDESNSLPWLINVCGEDGDCLEKNTVLKLAAMLNELVNVGTIYCRNNQEVCQDLGVEHGIHFYQSGDKVKKGFGRELSSLDAKEIAFSVLEQLPDVTKLDQKAFQDALDELNESRGKPWLVHFVEGDFHDLELRKLPALLSSMQVGRVDCRQARTECNNLHIHKFPTFTVFKTGGRHEIFYGRQTAHDIAAFARDSLLTPISTLGPSDFPQLIDSREPWFIDFFAPWCPPCMRLLPEFRKASKQTASNIKFGTVDCTVHVQLCSKYNIHSYPTTILYNETVPHQYHGNHGVHDIIEFVQDIMKPPVQVLTPESFHSLVKNRGSKEMWLIDFYAPWCGPCQQLAPEWRRLAKMLRNVAGVKVGQVDCQAHRSLCQENNVQSYPTVRLYPVGQTNINVFHVYNGWFRDAQSIRAWAFEYLPSKVTNLNYNQFVSKVVSSTDPWVVDFYAPWCGHCQVFAPEFERVAQTFEGRVNSGKVNCDENQWLCNEAGVNAYPSVRFYKGALHQGQKQSFRGEDIDSQEANFIIQFLNNRVPAAKVKRVSDEL